MKIIVESAGGAVGQAAVAGLGGRHEIIAVGLAYCKSVEGVISSQVIIVA